MTRGTARLSTFVLKLYVTGASPRTERAIANLRHICESELAGRYTLAIVDVLEDPEAAERDRVLATPTLIKELPLPLRRVIGDLSDRAKVLLALEVRPVGLHVSPESRGGGRRRGDPALPVRSEGRVGVAAPSRPE